MSPIEPWAVSTLGAPGAPLDELLTLAGRFGFGALEIRIEPGELVEPGTAPADPARIRERLDAAGLDVVAATSRVRLCSPDIDLDALRAALQTAALLGAPGLRVFMGGEDGDRAADERRAAAAVAAVAPMCARTGVDLYVETHDSHPTGRDVAAFLALLERELPGHPCRIVWDSAHSWSAGEPFADSFRSVAPRLAYVQVKDVAAGEDGRPTPIGEGAFPIGDLVAVLRDAAWPGWVSLEYERAWYPALPPLEEALERFAAWVARDVPLPRSAA